MKLSEYRDTYYEYTATASEVSRKAAFAGIAAVWIFHSDSESGLQLPSGLIAPLLLFAIGLAVDLLQYITGAIIWGTFHWSREHKLTDVQLDPDCSHPRWLSYPLNLLFATKMIFVVAGYVVFVSRVLEVMR